MDFTATVCLGHYSEDELRQLESELELSQVVQRALLPQQVPPLPGYDIAAFSRPAQIVTGDYFDFLQFEDGTYGFVVGGCERAWRVGRDADEPACRPSSTH